ncbi:MAG: hypothetical protein B7Z80_08220 [Rhodospirillales bacterium 20-64-7]|nr:MAG: hypothetical protein B7Z80_08220 [Rhodospirillales bacterium 20-64-7]HQT75909.1 hypothetical protein [Rhodopila sp.]
MDQIEGILIFAQESRFQVLDRNGVAHHFVLHHAAAAEPEQLPMLQRKQARVRVDFRTAPDLIAHAATAIRVLGA